MLLAPLLALSLPQNPLKAIKPAVSVAQIQEKLKAIPVFVIVNEKSVPLTALVENKPLLGVFLRRTSADLFADELRKSRPELPPLHVQVAPLAALRETAQKATPPLLMNFIPDPAEVAAANALLKAQGNDKPFPAVPVFLAKAPGKGYLTFERDGASIVPAFFSRQEVQALVTHYNQGRAADTPEATVEVSSLENLLQLMRTETSPVFSKITFIAARAALEEARGLTKTPKTP